MPGKSGNSNRAVGDEVERLGAGRARRSVSAPAKKAIKKREHPEAVKLECARQYDAWVQGGRPQRHSPMGALTAKYGVDRQYPKDMYDQLFAKGSIKDQRKGKSGRPRVYGDEVKAALQTIIREGRAQQKVVPAEKCARMLKRQAKRGAPSPCKTTVQTMKRTMGYTKKRMKKKPLISAQQRADRLRFALDNADTDMRQFVCLDEKMFTEDKKRNEKYEARQSSPVPVQERFYHRAAETDTQLGKFMYVTAMSEKGRIHCEKLWMDDADNVTAKGKKSTGMTAFVFKKFLDTLKKATDKKFGKKAELTLWMDRASCHKSCVPHAETLFSRVVLQPPRSPDFSPLDAALFPYMERDQQQGKATTLAEIEATVAKTWLKVTPTMCLRACNRVRANMRKCIADKGGNFYDESSANLRSRRQDNLECHKCLATYTEVDPPTSTMIICETCERGFHVGCAKMKSVPKGAWRCRLEGCVKPG
jgi:hypothetical protein